MKKTAIICALPFMLIACTTEQAAPPPPMTHAALPKVLLDVQSIALADRSGIQPTNSPYNSNHFSPTISDAIKQWANDRLQATGQSGQTVVIIKDASLTAQSLPVKDGMDSWFTRQQNVEYIGHAEISIETNGKEGFAIADASANRKVSLPENPTASEKQDAYYALLNGLMKDLGQNLDSSIQSHMGNFIVTAPVFGSTSIPTPALTQTEVTTTTTTENVATTPPLPEAPTAAPAPSTMMAPPPPSSHTMTIPLSGTNG